MPGSDPGAFAEEPHWPEDDPWVGWGRVRGECWRAVVGGSTEDEVHRAVLWWARMTGAAQVDVAVRQRGQRP